MIDPIIGWMGVGFGLLVAPPQLWKIVRTGKVGDISLLTYSFLVLAIVCYLIHAIYIRDTVFIVAQVLNLFTNTIILVYLVRGRRA